MKALKISLSIIIAILALSINSADAMFKEEYTKRFHEEYSADANTILRIKNKFGDVNIEDWNKDQVIIDVTIKVNTDSEEKANKVFERIRITIAKEGNLISAITEIDEKFNNTGKFSIDYSIKVPQYIKLELDNKFGNVFINDLSGEVNLNVSYGNLMINKLSRTEVSPMNVIDLAYCNKASINEMAKAKVMIKYSKIEIITVDELVLYSKYSKVSIEKVNSIISDAAYDAYKITEINNFSSIGKYCDYSINKLNNSIDIELKYGNLNIEYVSPDFESIKSDSKYGKVHYGIASNASYRLSAEVEYGGIEHPESNKLSKIKDDSETMVKGVIGTKENPKSSVSIQAQYGNVDLLR